MKIALIDLNHMTVGVHTNTVPLGIGMIAYYLKNNVANKFDIRMFKDPIKFLAALKNWKPDVLGITQYVWNSELNLYMAQLIKNDNPDSLIVAGGPNLYLSTEERFRYLKRYNFVDLCISYDGEIPFAKIIKRFIDGEKIRHIRKNPPEGAYSIEPQSGKFVESKENMSRLDSLDVFCSIYASGFLNGLLDEGFHPFLQTQRGCPFGCTYCHTGDNYYSQVLFQSAKVFRQDMEYLGRRFAGQHNITLYLANPNFSLFKEDFEIARVIREIQDKYDWPKKIDVNSGKNLDKLLKLLSILKYKFTPAIALQTLTPKVLINIKRKNISFKSFVVFQKKVIQYISKETATELILNLPQENKKSFLKTVALVLNSGVQHIVIYTLMSLRGTRLASRSVAKKYGHVIRHRIVPRCFSEINGVKIFETEEVVVGTKDMPFEDYLDLRGLALIAAAFASAAEMFPIRKFLMEYRLNIASWIFGIQKKISVFENLYSVYKSFLQETKDELFPSKAALVKFFRKQENYNLLCNGELGDNLLNKYKAIILSKHYREYLEVAFFRLRQMTRKKVGQKMLDALMNDFKLYLNSRDIGHIFKNGYTQILPRKVTLRYDIPKWLASEQTSVPLENHKGLFFYTIIITDYMQRRLNDFIVMNREPELSFQILYRDGGIKDFWPQWVSNNPQ